MYQTQKNTERKYIRVNFVLYFTIVKYGQNVQYYIVKIIIMKRFPFMNVNTANMHLNIAEKLNVILF